jgi:SAM-dependent methyltransferase
MEREVHSVTGGDSPAAIDEQNRSFWDELCGSGLARSLGLRDRDASTLARFDDAYFAMYPYLRGYLDRFDLRERRVLEIGLGYGTLGAAMAGRGAAYHGVDIAPGPVAMMRHRLSIGGVAHPENVTQASAAALPFADATFDFVYSIGCLHHTGQLATAVDEVHRVLSPGGRAVVMLYNAHSFRQLERVHLRNAVRRLLRRPQVTATEAAAMYDTDASGAAAPFTEFVSPAKAQRLFGRFEDVEIAIRNFDDLTIRGRRLLPRNRILGTPLERLLGLDLYIVGKRPLCSMADEPA